MYRLAFLSFHGCPIVRLGDKDAGGMNVYVLQIARFLAKRGIKIDVFTRYHDSNDPEIVQLIDGARVIHLKAGAYVEAKEELYECIPEFLKNINSFQKKENISYDLIHSHYWLSGHLGKILSHEWNIPHVTTFHTLARTKLMARPGERESELRDMTEREIADKADAVVVSTKQEKSDLVTFHQTKNHKIRVIPAGVDLGLFYPVDKIQARRLLDLTEGNVILSVGRLLPLKGLNILIEAVSLLEQLEHTRLIIVGGGKNEGEELNRLQSLAVELGIRSKVTFIGAVEQRELPNYYSSADVFVLPSYHESFGLVALESMACGTPVVASRVGGMKTFVKDGQTGYLIPWQCPEPFAEKLNVLLANPVLTETMGRHARIDALEMGWDVAAKRMLDFYSSMLIQTISATVEIEQ